MEKVVGLVTLVLWVILLAGLPVFGVFKLIKKYQLFPKRESGKILIIEAGGRATAIIPEVKGWYFDPTK